VFLPSSIPRFACAAFGLLLAVPAHAGRPLATDDAATAGASTCQLEGWFQRNSAQREWVLAPACGIGESFELGLEGVRPSPRDGVHFGGAVALKWVPGAKFATPLGALVLGAKAGASHAKPPGGQWRHTGADVAALASLAPSDRWSLHANAGTRRERDAGVNASVLNVAAAYESADSWLAFVEALANDRRPLLGNVVRGAGVRWWVTKDRLGFDVTASRQAGGTGGTLWTVGFGWYGIGY
jgi:hypothetical protein